MIAHDSPNINDEGVFISKGGKDCWLQTYSGRRVSVMNPSPEEIDINDIAVSIAKQCRFNGHCSSFYSVAEHCSRGAGLAYQMYGKEVAKEFLLHDATEAYMGDLIRPVKRMIPRFEEMEQRFWKAISSKFGLPYTHSREVHYLDNVMVVWEKENLLPNSEPWPNLPDISSLNLPKLVPQNWQSAQKTYENMFHLLFEMSEQDLIKELEAV